MRLYVNLIYPIFEWTSMTCGQVQYPTWGRGSLESFRVFFFGGGGVGYMEGTFLGKWNFLG